MLSDRPQNDKTFDKAKQSKYVSGPPARSFLPSSKIFFY